MITVLVFWISCHYNKDVDLLYAGAVLIDLFIVSGVFKLLVVEL